MAGFQAINLQEFGLETIKFLDCSGVLAGNDKGRYTHFQNGIVSVFRHLSDKGDGGAIIDPVFALVANSPAILDTDRERLPVKFIKNGEAWLNNAHMIGHLARE